jgi:methylated-DNA-[protein]-cysteine S-methyltransferase
VERNADDHSTCGVDSPLDELTLVGDDAVLIGVYFRNHWYRPAAESLGVRVDADTDSLLAAAGHQLTDFLTGGRTDFDLPIRFHDDSRDRVWKLLSAIPYGETVTYGELAAALGDGTTAQEVGQAVGRNPLSIVVPCHRVVGRDGRLTGYAGGLARKQFLLELEEPAEVRAARLF